MKSTELLKKYPQSFLIWNLNEETSVFWTELSILEDNGLRDPWGQKITLRGAKRVSNSANDVVEFRIIADCQGYPVELSIINE